MTPSIYPPYDLPSPVNAPFPRHLCPSPEHPPGGGFDSGCMIIFSLFWTAFSLLFVIFPLAMFWREWQDYTLLKASGETAQGVVIDRRIDEDSDGDSYYVTYRFMAPVAKEDHQYFSHEQSVNRKTYRVLHPETRVNIVYAPSDPSVSRLEGKLGSPFYLLFIASIGGFFVLIGLAILSSGWKTMRQASALKRRGQPAQATVLDTWTDQDSDGDKVYCVAYRFIPPGRPQVTKAEYNQAAYKTLLPGDGVWVRYLPENPYVARLEL